MSLQIHYLDSHLDFFPNKGSVSDELGDQFHQQMFVTENLYTKENG